MLIVTYQRAMLLENCLRALERQQRIPDEILVVGVDGDAPAAAVVDEFAASAGFPSGWRSTPVPSVVEQTNLGLDACCSEIVAFTNDDAEPRTDWLARMEPYYEDATVGGVGGRDYVYRDGQLWRGAADRVGQIAWYGRHYGNHHLDYPRVTEVKILKGVNMSCRRELLGPLDSRMVSGGRWHWELDVCAQVWGQGKRLVYDPQICVDHYLGPRPSSADPDFVYAASHNLTLNFSKHLPNPQRWLFIAYDSLWGTYPEMGLAVFGRTYLERLVRYGDWGFVRLLVASLRGKWDALGALRRGP